MPEVNDDQVLELEEKPIETAAPVVEPVVPGEDDDDDEQNPDGDPATPEEGEKPGEEQPKKKGKWQRRLDKEVKRRAGAERERDYFRDEYLKTRTPGEKREATETKPGSVTEEANPEPKLADFESWDDFFKARDKWALNEARKIAREEVSTVEKRRTDAEQERQKQADDRKLQEAFDEREEKASTKYKDWEDVAGTGDDPTVFIELTALKDTHPGVSAIAAILGSADPEGDLEYYLASNPEEIARIAKLRPDLAQLELGKLLGTKLAPQESSATKANAAAAASKALPPPKTLNKTTPTATGVDADMAKNNPDEYFRRREAQIIEQQRKGRKR